MQGWLKWGRRAIAISLSVSLLIFVIWTTGLKEAFESIADFPAWLVGSIIVIFFANLAVVSFRLWRTLRHFGIQLPHKVISQASISGHLAGLMFISLFGQVLGRHIVLRKFGVSPIVIAMATAYERVVLVVIGGGLCAIGAAILLSRAEVIQFLVALSVFDIALVVTCVAIVTFLPAVIKGKSWARNRRWIIKNTVSFFEIAGASVVGQGLVLSAFVLSIFVLEPKTDLVSAFAAAAMISFAASIPITINGWGVRELASVYMLGLIGIPDHRALATSIMIGACSTAVILLVAPFTLRKARRGKSADEDSETQPPEFTTRFINSDIERVAVSSLGFAAAVLVFFQAHLSLPSGTVNLNLADPFAFLSFATVVALVISKRKLPEWQVDGFNLGLLLLSFLLIFGFLVGVAEIGITQWALVNRLLGWVVLLGYISIGYLVVCYTGQHGLRRLAETVILTAFVIVVVQASARGFSTNGIDLGFNLTGNFEGYSANRNSFAFQLVVSSVLILAFSKLRTKSGSYPGGVETSVLAAPNAVMKTFRWLARSLYRHRYSLIHGTILLGIYFTGSRTGLITVAVVLVVALVLRIIDWKSIIVGMVSGVAQLALLSITLPTLRAITPSSGDGKELQIATHWTGEESQSVRLETILRGLEMWWESPFLGSGLGTFIENSPKWFSGPIVIHSTPVWILSEFGLFGLITVLFVFWILIRHWLNRGITNARDRSVFLLLIVFSVFSLPHEIFYQRIFWLVLGASAATYGWGEIKRIRAVTRVFHVITGLGAGGAERMLTRIVGTRGQNDVEHTVVSLMDGGVFGDEIRNKGVTLHTLGMRRNRANLSGTWLLTQLISREKPDVVMTWLYHADLVGLIASLFTGIRRVYWNIRCSDMTKESSVLLSWFMLRVLALISRVPTAVVINSKAGKLHHQAQGYSPKQWLHISNGVDMERFHRDRDMATSVRKELNIPHDAILIGHIARYHPMKDHESLIRAAADVVREEGNVFFVLVGRDVDTNNQQIMELVTSNNVTDWVRLLGNCRDIPRLLNGIDIVVMSSAYGEGSPNAVTEAMSCCVPCVVTDVGDAADIVGETGIVVPPSSPEKLRDGILQMVRYSRDYREALGRRALDRVRANYDIHTVVARYRQLFVEGQ